MTTALRSLDDKLVILLKQWDDTHDAIMRVGNSTPENLTERMRELHQQRKWMTSELHSFSRYLDEVTKEDAVDVTPS